MSSADARLGIWLAVIASAGFSLKAILAKLAYPHGVDPVTLVALRMLLAAPVFVVVAWREARRGATPESFIVHQSSHNRHTAKCQCHRQ